MSRPENKMVMGYFAFDEKHHPALLSLVQPAHSASKILDPFAGEGVVLEQMARAWHATPYANELDGARAEACRQRFGAKQALRGDAERLLASNNAFSLVWINPPYDHDTSESGSKRLEFKYLRHSWKWGMTGALMMWVIYQHHLTEDAASFLAKNSLTMDVWACPGKHLNEYDQIIVVAIKGKPTDPEALYEDILRQKAQPHLLEIQDEPCYTLPKPNKDKRFVFTASTIEPDQGAHLIQAHGAWHNNGFQTLLIPPPPAYKIQPIVAPRPGHTALVLAAGVANGAILESTEYGTVALRGKTVHTEEISRVDIEADPNDPDHQIKKTTLRLKPTTTLTLLSADGKVVEMDGDDALLKFISDNRTQLATYLNQQFQPAYTFDLNGMGRWLSKIRLKGKYPLYTAQKHVIGAITKGFEKHKGILLAGQMGVGKTALGSSVAISLSANIVQALQDDIRPNQVTLIIAPPHLIDKWQRELLSISRNIHVAKLQRHEDVKAFMQHADKLGAGIPKIGLIKRDMTKLGSGHEPAIIWRKQARALWRQDQPTPHGYEVHERIVREKVPQCPHCGTTITRERKGQTLVADAKWLKAGKRDCPKCHTPLWQMVRDRGSRPKAGQKYPPKPPRYRLDEFIKRHYADRLYLLIWDEVHESQRSDTGNGASFARLASCADKVLGLTGTPFNGRSSSLFNLEYALNPRVRQRFNWGGAPRFNRKERGQRHFQAIISDDRQQRGRAEARWVEQMGVRERVLEERPQYNADTGAYTGTTTYERPYTEAPGISPLLVAEMLDHTVYFSLKDLGKALPQFEEIAVPVAMDDDIASEYDQTRTLLKDYLVQRRWEGDATFRGAYLQWSMGWQNAPFRPTDIIHNIKHPITGEKRPHIVKRIASYGDERLYTKEQALIDTLQQELAQGRPCVVYLRQTGTKDIQPRYERLIREYVAGAKPFILKNTVSAERREKVIDAEIAKGMNVLITNPELVKTGLDLLFAPTLIFAEIVFNLSTLMQAAARSYRLNQTHEHCKVLYFYYQDTMEQTAVHLMSRKQRAAKLLTGEAGLTGLDALTTGEGGFEQALLAAISQEDVLVNPTELFTSDANTNALDAEDMAFWNVDAEDFNDTLSTEAGNALPEVILLEGAPTVTPTVTPITKDIAKDADATSNTDEQVTQQADSAVAVNTHPALMHDIADYLKDKHLVADGQRYAKLQAQLIQLIRHGEQRDDGTFRTLGMSAADYFDYPSHALTLHKRVVSWLKKHTIVFMDTEEETAQAILRIAKHHLRPKSVHLTNKASDETPDNVIAFPREFAVVHGNNSKRKKLDLMALPPLDDDVAPTQHQRASASKATRDDDAPKQLAMF